MTVFVYVNTAEPTEAALILPNTFPAPVTLVKSDRPTVLTSSIEVVWRRGGAQAGQ
jgi:hypothetical protein